MARLIRNFSDGSTLEYDKGNFDDWCVYLTRPNVVRHAPQDFQYFDRLIQYGQTYGAERVYNDFVSIYDMTSAVIDNGVFNHIDQVSQSYGNDSLNIAIDMSILYMGMVAEENKRFTKLGKRVKRLGVYQVLMEGHSYREAANFSRGMGWRDIAALCLERGF